MKIKLNAEINSTIKYCILIPILHFRHFPFKKRKEKKGILSNHLICSLHEGQKDLPLITFCSNGRR